MTVKVRGCEICKQPIDAERMAGVPATRLCREHGERIEKYGGEFRLVAKDERTSKKQSIKITYGAVSVSSKRNTQAIERLRRDYEEEQYGS